MVKTKVFDYKYNSDVEALNFSEEMIEAGSVALLRVFGGTDLPYDFSVSELVKKIYADMEFARNTKCVPAYGYMKEAIAE